MKGKYETYFQNWMSDNLPESKFGCIIQDIDAIIQNLETKRFMVLELKTRNNNLTYPQKCFYNMLHKRLAKTNGTDGWKYMGTVCLRFENDTFYDGWVELNGERIDEYKMQQFIYNKLGFDTYF